jgi:hypothetical protein
MRCLLFFVCLMFASPALAQTESASCTSAAHRALDFRLGTFDGVTTNGAPAGTTKVERVAGSCALLERWQGAQGGDGIGLFTYADGAWHFTYVNEDGETLRLKGQSDGNGVVMTGANRFYDFTGIHRIRWQQLADGLVLQSWDVQRRRGRPWERIAEITFLVRPATAAP